MKRYEKGMNEVEKEGVRFLGGWFPGRRLIGGVGYGWVESCLMYSSIENRALAESIDNQNPLYSVTMFTFYRKPFYNIYQELTPIQMSRKISGKYMASAIIMILVGMALGLIYFVMYR